MKSVDAVELDDLLLDDMTWHRRTRFGDFVHDNLICFETLGISAPTVTI